MKTFSLIAVAAALLLSADAVQAQDAPPPPAEPTTPAAAEPAPPTPAPGALFPETTPGAPAATTPRTGGSRGNGAGAGRRNKTNRRNSQFATDAAVSLANQDPLDVRVAYRKAKTQAIAREPALIDLLQAADAAKTDDEKRGYLKQYYTRLYALVKKIDPSPTMKAHVALLAQASEQRYDPKRRAVAGEDDLAGVGRNGGRNRR